MACFIRRSPISTLRIRPLEISESKEGVIRDVGICVMAAGWPLLASWWLLLMKLSIVLNVVQIFTLVYIECRESCRANLGRVRDGIGVKINEVSDDRARR